MDQRIASAAAGRIEGAAASGLPRRQFLVMGASTVVAAMFDGVLGQSTAAGAFASRPLSVGFVEESEAWESFDALPWSRPNADGVRSGPEGDLEVVPATDLLLGDQTLAGELVEVTFGRLLPQVPGRDSGVESISLTLFFPSPDPTVSEPLGVAAWHTSLLPVLNAPTANRMVVPVGLHGELTVRLDVLMAGGRSTRSSESIRLASPDATAAAAPAERDGRLHRFETTFTVDWFAGQPRLQRGVYLLGLGDTVWQRGGSLPLSGEISEQRLSVVMTVERHRGA